MNLEPKLKIYFISSDKDLVTLFHKLTKATHMGQFYIAIILLLPHDHTQSCFPVARNIYPIQKSSSVKVGLPVRVTKALAANLPLPSSS